MTDLELAERVARAAGALLLERYADASRGLELKTSDTDFVSSADRDAEKLIVGMLRAERPDDGLIGEEGAAEREHAERRWVIDPIDGTVNFVYGYPQWAVSVAVEDGSGPLAGVVHDPLRDETFGAARGEGAQLNGTPLRVRGLTELDTALVATGFAYDRDRRGAQGRLAARVLPAIGNLRRGGAAALDLAWLAAGRLDGYYEHGLNAWDWSAGSLLVREAGGELAELPGDPPGLAAANAELLPALVELVAGAATRR